MCRIELQWLEKRQMYANILASLPFGATNTATVWGVRLSSWHSHQIRILAVNNK